MNYIYAYTGVPPIFRNRIIGHNFTSEKLFELLTNARLIQRVTKYGFQNNIFKFNLNI